MVDDATLRIWASHLMEVPGVAGVLLGGSRARGDHTPASDVDLGVYYRPPLGVAELGELAQSIAGAGAHVTEPGEWGPWVDGGAWLTVEGVNLDWIYRDVDRVHAAWASASEGEYQFHFQVGHPLGMPDFTYAGEIALGIILADPSGELADLQQATRSYPRPLAEALISGMWEAAFTIDIARKSLIRSDTAYVAGCLFRVVGVCAHALHGAAGRWLINEKGAVAAAGRLPGAPADFTARAHGLLAGLGTTPDELNRALDVAAELVREVRRRLPMNHGDSD